MNFLKEDIYRYLEVTGLNKNDSINLVLDNVIEFVEKDVYPKRFIYDIKGNIEMEEIKRAFRQRIHSIPYTEVYGGLGLPYLVYIIAMEILAYGSPSLQNVVWASGSVIDGIANFGSEWQKENFLKPLLNGEMIAAIAMTEPTGGSAIESIETKALKRGNHYLINGIKTFITNAPIADLLLVFAKTSEGMTAFIVPKDSQGLTIGNPMEKLGLRGTKISQVFLNNVEVPKDYVIGKEGTGKEIAKHIFIGGRVVCSSLALGIMDASVELALSFAMSRKVFGKPLMDYQLIKGKIADMKTLLDVSKLYTYYVAFLASKYPRFKINREASIAKLFSTESAMKVSNDLISIYGGYGYVNETNVHMFWRDSRALTIYEGTSDIQRLIIQHELKGVKGEVQGSA